MNLTPSWLRSLAFAALSLTAVACGGTSPTASCSSLCTSSGFMSGMAMEASNEINCFCTGSSGTVTAGACSNMCTALGKAKGSAFASGAGTGPNSCQCE